MNFEFTEYGWEDFQYWIETDASIVEKINSAHDNPNLEFNSSNIRAGQWLIQSSGLSLSSNPAQVSINMPSGLPFR
jgi:hypothetical protein